MDIKLNTIKTYSVVLNERELSDVKNIMAIFRDMYRGDFLVNDGDLDEEKYAYLFWLQLMNIVEQIGNMTASDFVEIINKLECE